MNKIRQGEDYPMATMSSARFRSLYRRRKQAYEAVYHFSANPVRHVVTGFSATPNHRNLASTFCRRTFRAALRREMAKAGLA